MNMRYDDEQMIVSGINVTPLVDIMMVLLIIFMVTATFVSERAMEVNLPKSATSENAPTPALTVTLGKNGELKLMKKDVTLDQLRSMLANEVKIYPDEKVLLKAEKDLPYYKVAEALEAIKLAGVRKVALAMERK
jgi:biopolymer transport protein ExbD